MRKVSSQEKIEEELTRYIDRERRLINDLESAKEARLVVETSMNNLVGELKVKDLKLGHLKSKEEELAGKLEMVEQRFTMLNDSILSETHKQMMESQDKSYDMLSAELSEARTTIVKLEEITTDIHKDCELAKLGSLAKSRLIDSLNKQIEELQTQLATYQNKDMLNNLQTKPDEAGALELSFRSFDGSRIETNSVIDERRRSSLTAKKKYEMKSSHFATYQAEKLHPNQQTHRYEEMKSIILHKRKVSLMDAPKETYLINFQGYGYLCENDHKTLKIIVYQQNTVYVITQKGMKIEYEFPTNNIKELVASSTNNFLYKIDFQTEGGSKIQSIVLEIPNGLWFLKVIQNSLYFDADVFRTRRLNIENNISFRNASLNLFHSAKRSCILETWVNSFSANWDINYYVLVDTVLMKFSVPLVFQYSDYHKVIRRPYMYLLENYNFIGDEKKIGLARPNTFALKIQNESKDVVVTCLILEEKEAWAKMLC